jgi:hypothetical protein
MGDTGFQRLEEGEVMARIVKERDLDVYASPRRWAGNPNILLLQSGEILIGFRTAGFPIRGDSDPSLRPFSVKAANPDAVGAAEPVMILDEPNSLTPAFFQRDDGLILTFFNRYATHEPEKRATLEASGCQVIDEREELIFTREPITVMASRDGVRWEPFGEIDIPGYAYPPAFRGNMIKGRDGAILFSVYTSAEPKGFGHMRALLIRSRDGGTRWEFVSDIAGSENGEAHFDETSLLRTASGRLVAFLRGGGEDKNIHTAVSDDDGLTWSPVRRHGVYGYPQSALRLASGRVWLTYGVRRDPAGVCGKLLDAECTNIDTAPEVRVRHSSTGACGYPMSVQLEHGTILTVYYVTLEHGQPAHIAGSMLREEDGG